MSDVAPAVRAAGPVVVADGLETEAATLARASRSPATWRAYAADLADFEAWCATAGRRGAGPDGGVAGETPCALPADPGTLAQYLTDLARTHTPATLERRLAAIAVAHRVAGYDSPTADARVAAVRAGIRRRHGVAPRRAKAADTAVLTRLLATLGTGLADRRDAALLLLGMPAALRRSELVALDVGDVVEDHHGLRVFLARSKTDPDGEGALVGVPYGSDPARCPVRAWRAWLAASGITTGPAFRPVDRHGHLGPTRLSGQAVSRMVTRRAAAAGLGEGFSAHSLRSGFATAAYAAGVPELAIMRHGRWQAASTMRGYVATGGLWTNNPATRLGL